MLNQQVHAIRRPLVEMRHGRRGRSPRASEHKRVRTRIHFRRQILRESNNRTFLCQIVHGHAKTKHWGLSSDIPIRELRSRRHGPLAPTLPHGLSGSCHHTGFKCAFSGVPIWPSSLHELLYKCKANRKVKPVVSRDNKVKGNTTTEEKNNAKRDGVCMRDQAPTERRVLSEKLHDIKIVANAQNVGHWSKKEKESHKTKVMVAEHVFDNTFKKCGWKKWRGPRKHQGTIMFACSQTYTEHVLE